PARLRTVPDNGQVRCVETGSVGGVEVAPARLVAGEGDFVPHLAVPGHRGHLGYASVGPRCAYGVRHHDHVVVVEAHLPGANVARTPPDTARDRVPAVSGDDQAVGAHRHAAAKRRNVVQGDGRDRGMWDVLIG